MELKIHHSFNKNDFIQYIDNGFNYQKSFYKNIDDVINDCIHISEFGDLSSVRKTIKKINPHIDHKISPIISEFKLQELEEKLKIKRGSIPQLQIKRGSTLVYF
mgnify:CR=1 FL=1